MPFDAGEHNDHAELRRQRVDRLPQMRCPFARCHRVGGRRLNGALRLLELAQGPTSIRTLSIEGQSPCHPHEPGAETLPIPELPETPVGLREGLLRDVLRVLPVAQHAIRHAKRETGGFGEPGFELPSELVLHGYEAACQLIGAVMHVCHFGSPAVGYVSSFSKTPPNDIWFGQTVDGNADGRPVSASLEGRYFRLAGVGFFGSGASGGSFASSVGRGIEDFLTLFTAGRHGFTTSVFG